MESFIIWVRNNLFLKIYATSEGAISHNVSYYQRLSIAHYQKSFYANNYFELSMPLSDTLVCMWSIAVVMFPFKMPIIWTRELHLLLFSTKEVSPSQYFRLQLGGLQLRKRSDTMTSGRWMNRDSAETPQRGLVIIAPESMSSDPLRVIIFLYGA